MQQFYRFADVYGRDAYGTSEYSCDSNNTATCVANGSAGSTSGGGGLADTGMYVLAFVTLACLIVFAALMVRFWRRPKLQPQEVELEQFETDELKRQ